MIITCLESDWTREKARPQGAAPTTNAETAQMCCHVIVASAYSKPAKKVVSAYLEWSPTPMRARALPCILLSSEIEALLWAYLNKRRSEALPATASLKKPIYPIQVRSQLSSRPLPTEGFGWCLAIMRNDD